MRSFWRRGAAPGLAVMLALLALPGQSFGQDATACGKFKWPVGRELAAFGSGGLAAIDSGQAMPPASTAAILRLKPQGEVKFALAPERPPRVASPFAGVFTAPAPSRPGLYQVTLSDEAWIDVIQNGKTLRSAAFSGQSGCAAVRKSVRFRLDASPVTVQVSGAARATLNAVVLPAE